MKTLTLDNVTIGYGEKIIIDCCSFNLSGGNILSLLGASGCGKSTLLKAIAGLLPLHSGRIAFDDELLSKPDWHLSPDKRGVGMIFQDYALFPHLTVADNITFGLHKLPKKARRTRCAEGLELVRLTPYTNRYPHELSGGQQQRVAIARALVCQPKVLLFDEPFSNLDIAVRETLMHDIKMILKSQRITAIFVTHDKNEAFAMADDIAIIQGGKIAQYGPSQQVYDRPNSRYVAEFLGNGVLLPATQTIKGWQTPIGTIEEKYQNKVLSLKNEEEQRLHVYLRPHQINIQSDKNGRAVVKGHSFRGDLNFYQLDLSDESICVLTQKRFSINESVNLSIALS
ncbi:MAG: hypothetical protein CSA45_03735 [Gammaproteobacteria bacterium]|nr:MAG: hypothetical protein CSA45_03735 [Gammaproteobacteria bacterium]